MSKPATPTTPMDRPTSTAFDPGWLDVTPIRLRCNVIKRTLVPGRGDPLDSAWANLMFSYVLYITKRPSAQALAAAGHTPPPDGNASIGEGRRIEAAGPINATTGVTSLVPGLEVGLLSMTEGERAIIEVMPDMAFDEGQTPTRMEITGAAETLFFDVTMRNVTGGTRVNGEIIKFVQQEGGGGTAGSAAKRPEYEAAVEVQVRKAHPLTGQLGKFEKMAFTVGGRDSTTEEDAVVMSMVEGELATVYIRRFEYVFMLRKVTPPSSPLPVEIVEVEGALLPRQSSSGAPVDDAAPKYKFVSRLLPAERFAAARLRKDEAQSLMEAGLLRKAAEKYQRAALIVTAEPSLLAQVATEAESRDLLGVLYHNVGRMLEKEGREYGQALRWAEESVKTNPGYMKGYYLRQQLYRLRGMYKEAREDLAFLDYQAAQPEPPKGCPSVADISAERARIDEAEEADKQQAAAL